jgi:hypothetical protein
VGSFDGTVTVWDLHNGAKRQQFVSVPPGTTAPD